MDHKESLPFYHTAAWRRVRKLAIQREGGMCADCMRLYQLGIIRGPHRATMVHHIQPVEERPDLALDLDNLVALCDACHNARHPEKGRKEDAPPIASGPRVIKV